MVEGRDGEYFQSGNVLLDHLMGASVHTIEASVDATGYMEELAETVRGRGGTPYIVPMGGSNPVGALGYVRCAEEIAIEGAGIGATHVVHASGSAGTQSGLAAGLAALDSSLGLVAIGVKPSNGAIQRDVEAIVPGVLNILMVSRGGGAVRPSPRQRGLLGPGLWIAHRRDDRGGDDRGTPRGIAARPVYTGKAMAGLFDLARTGKLGAEDTVVFVHTGGAPGLFAYPVPVPGLVNDGLNAEDLLAG